MAEVPRLGARGGGWVALQFAVMAAILVLGLLGLLGLLGPGWPDEARWWLKIVGLVILVAGVLVVFSATRTLGPAMTPYPRPKDSGALVAEGPYAVVRHPIYSGGILVFGAISLALSPLALACTAVLAVVWGLKASVEERFLTDRYPGYSDYCSRTRYRLVPFVY